MEHPGKYKELPGRTCYLILLFLHGLLDKEEGDELIMNTQNKWIECTVVIY
jgi:hypothetical protein